jgi:hypothetical protein
MDPLTLPRIEITGSDDLETFKRKLAVSSAEPRPTS